jgi:hypothetical protein
VRTNNYTGATKQERIPSTTAVRLGGKGKRLKKKKKKKHKNKDGQTL